MDLPVKVQSGSLISVQDLHRLLQKQDSNLVVVDSRSPADYAEGHIPGAVNVHDIFTYLATTTDTGLKALEEHFAAKLGEAGVEVGNRVVVYEQGLKVGFGQSCRGRFLLRYLGVRDVSVLDGALEAWIRHQYPLSKEPSSRPRCQFTPRVVPELMATRDDVLALVQGYQSGKLSPAQHVLLDVRDKGEWLGTTSSPYDKDGKDFAPKRGRWPGAVWSEWYRFLVTPEGGVASTFAPAEAIRAELQRHGVDSLDTPITVICFKGSRSSNTMLALELAGFRNVKNAFGGWNEWCRDDSLPVDSTVLQE